MATAAGCAKTRLLSLLAGWVVSVGFLLLPHGSGAQSFAPVDVYPVSGVPVTVTAADVNGDGSVDLVTVNNSASTMTVLTNDGSGRFAVRVTQYTLLYPGTIAAADVNGDGRADLACGFNNGTHVMVLMNDGGSFTNFSTYDVGGPTPVLPADLNGDGSVDLLCCNGGVLLTNAGNGTFATGPAVEAGSAYAAIADLNSDRKPDLVEAVSFSGNKKALKIYTNSGNATFSLLSTNALPLNWPGSICTGDINGDGMVDVIVPDYASGGGTNLYVFTNDGSGVLVSNATYTVAKGPASVVAADINGDAWVDLLSAGTFGTLSVLTNDGHGGFVAAPAQDLGASSVGSLIAADLNGDGKLDLVTANINANSISVLMNTSVFPAPTSTPKLAMTHGPAGVEVSWPSASAGWSLFQTRTLAAPSWSPGGYDGYSIVDDGTTCHLAVAPGSEGCFFRLLHP